MNILNHVIFPVKIQILKPIGVPHICVYVLFKNDKHVIWMWIRLILKNISRLDRIWSLWLVRFTLSQTNFIFWIDRLIFSVSINSHPDNIYFLERMILLINIKDLVKSYWISLFLTLFQYIPMYIANHNSSPSSPLSGPGWLNEFGSLDYITTHTSLSPIQRGFAPGFVNYKTRGSHEPVSLTWHN